MDNCLSVIVPIYNAEKYLPSCMESILGQAYANLEVVLVDDGSRDSSLEICRKYAGADPRVTVLHREKGGVVSARKAGVRAARGEMIGFVDADDWIEPDYFGRMMEAWRATGADIVTSGHFHDIGESSRRITDRVPVGLHETKDILDVVLYSGEFYEYGITPTLCTKIFRPGILKAAQEKVDERIQCGEDAAVVYPAVFMAETVCVTDFCGYHYVQRQGSMTKEESREDVVLVRLAVKFLEGRIRELAPDARSREALLGQLEVYHNYMLSLRGIHIFDEKVLLPFGGIPCGSRVVVYGAGVLGQRIHRYLLDSGRVDVAGWVDQNAGYYRENGFCVEEPGFIASQTYDYVLIANISYGTAMKIKKFLMEELSVDEAKIRWFSDEFVKKGRETQNIVDPGLS